MREKHRNDPECAERNRERWRNKKREKRKEKEFLAMRAALRWGAESA
jgi:hypothetical protein